MDHCSNLTPYHTYSSRRLDELSLRDRSTTPRQLRSVILRYDELFDANVELQRRLKIIRCALATSIANRSSDWLAEAIAAYFAVVYGIGSAKLLTSNDGSCGAWIDVDANRLYLRWNSASLQRAVTLSETVRDERISVNDFDCCASVSSSFEATSTVATNVTTAPLFVGNASFGITRRSLAVFAVILNVEMSTRNQLVRLSSEQPAFELVLNEDCVSGDLGNSSNVLAKRSRVDTDLF